MTLPADIAQLSPPTIAALRSLLGFSVAGRVTAPQLALRSRGHFTSQGVYEVTWQDFVIVPNKTRFSKGQDVPLPFRLCVEQVEVDGVLVNRLVARVLPPADSITTVGAGHAVGAVAMFPVSQIEVLSSPAHFPLADAYETAPPVAADIGIRFRVTTPAGNRGGFSLIIKPGSSTLYFQGEDAMPVASVHENEQRHGAMNVRMTLE